MDMPKLVRAIQRHGGLSRRDIIEAGQHGADAGWGGFTYTRDAARFYQRHKEEIWELLNEQADDCGENVLTMIAAFGRKDMSGDVYQFENLLAWFALEEAGRWLESQPHRRYPDASAYKT